MRVNVNILIAFNLLILLILLNSFTSCNDDISIDTIGDRTLKTNKADEKSSYRTKFKAPTLIDFGTFKKLFHKHYESLAENLRRKKIFLAKINRSFISSIKYKLKKCGHYLKINQMSDWTAEEKTRLRGEYKRSDRISKHGLSEPLDETNHFNTDDFATLDSLNIKPNRAKLNRYFARFRIFNGLTDSEPKNSDYLQLPVKGVKFYELSPILPKIIYGKAMKVNKPEDGDAIFIDHRQSECLNPIRNQGMCGSCYAFASIALFEWLNCMENGELLEFSEQYIIDCGKTQDRLPMLGCDCGVSIAVANFMSTYGVQLRENYPYTAKNGKCPYNTTNVEEVGHYRLTSKFKKAIYIPKSQIEYFLQYTPILVRIAPKKEFEDYGGGIDSGNSLCINEDKPKKDKKFRFPFVNSNDKDKSDQDPNDYGIITYHAMLLVGSGREEGQEYWILRNSYGTSWGEEGYYRVSKESDCILKQVIIFATKDAQSFSFDLVEKPENMPISQNLAVEE